MLNPYHHQKEGSVEPLIKSVLLDVVKWKSVYVCELFNFETGITDAFSYYIISEIIEILALQR
jgi:hypothetical protein